jgi:hypothetical protein
MDMKMGIGMDGLYTANGVGFTPGRFGDNR